MTCKYNHDEFCVNDLCPMCGDYCPVPNVEGVCQYEEREEERYTLTPKGCLNYALMARNIYIDDDELDLIWETFSEVMTNLGYVQED